MVIIEYMSVTDIIYFNRIKMPIIFNWNSIDNLGDYLADKRLDIPKEYMMKWVIEYLQGEGGDWIGSHIDIEWFRTLSFEQKKEIIESVGYQYITFRGKYRESNTKYYTCNDPLRIEFYACCHLCELTVILAWHICRVIWPDRKFLLVWDTSAEHAYVIEKDIYHTIYDINWYSFNVDPNIVNKIVNPENGYKYETPIEYIKEHLSIE